MNQLIRPENNYIHLAKYGLMTALLGVMSYMMFFPDGIYYAFFCGSMSIAMGVLSRRYIDRKGAATAAIIIGLVDIVMALVAFQGLSTIYSYIHDPVMGPRITEYISEFMAQYGLTLQNFAELMG